MREILSDDVACVDEHQMQTYDNLWNVLAANECKLLLPRRIWHRELQPT